MFPSRNSSRSSRTATWLSGNVWAVISAWGSAGSGAGFKSRAAYSPPSSSPLTIGAAVRFAAQLLANAVKADGALRKCASVFSGPPCRPRPAYSGHQALMIAKPAMGRHADVTRPRRMPTLRSTPGIAALPAILLSDEAGRPIGPIRFHRNWRRSDQTRVGAPGRT